MSQPGDNLVFHFLTSRAFQILGTTDGSPNNEFALLLQVYGGDSALEQGGENLVGPGLFLTPNTALTVNGVDMTVGFDVFDGMVGYDFTAQASSSIRFPRQPQGAYGSNAFDVQLTGIDALDAEGNLIGSAVFQTDGNAMLDVTTAPEPASFALLATGLIAIGRLRLRRRSRATA